MKLEIDISKLFNGTHENGQYVDNEKIIDSKIFNLLCDNLADRINYACRTEINSLIQRQISNTIREVPFFDDYQEGMISQIEEMQKIINSLGLKNERLRTEIIDLNLQKSGEIK